MPELPEVEAVRTQLEKFLLGHKLKRVEVYNKKVAPDNFKTILGAQFEGVRRFGKVIVFDFANGYSIIAHIKLTGQFVYRGPRLNEPPPLSKKVSGGVPGKHTHVVFMLNSGGVLYYNDIRRFGWIRVVKTIDVEKFDFIRKLGPEPLKNLTLERFEKILSSTRQAVKVVIMDQKRIGGVGNIYANDALWLSKIHPGKPANQLDKKAVRRLYDAIEKVLKKSIEVGGASELAFVTPDGSEGNYQKHFLAYGKKGELCQRCKKQNFKKISLGGRGTYFCPKCQK